VGAEVPGGKADQVAGREGPFAGGLAKHWPARDHVQPLLDPVVVAVRPDRLTGVALVDAGADPVRPEPVSDRRGDVTEPSHIEGLVELDAEDVDLPDAH
jgi:hypothetical protein